MRNMRAHCVALVIVAIGAAVTCSGQVVINEIAWGGTAASASDEWIELKNVSDEVIDLSGWTLRVDGSVIQLGEVADSTVEVRRTSIEPGGYFLLERTDDTTVSDIEADILYTGGLSNGGEDLFLVDADGATVDEVLAAETGWPAGAGGDGEGTAYRTMERLFPTYNGQDWAGNKAELGSNGLDAEGAGLSGTPRAENSWAETVATAPRIEILSPLPGVVEGTVILQWVAVDPDGDDSALLITLLTSVAEVPVEGQPAVSFATNIANTGSYAWDTMALEDGEYYVHVWIQEGDFVWSATRGPYMVSNNP